MSKFEGGCLCGSVRYRSDADMAMGGHCYCIDCRKSSGTSHCSHLAVPQAALHLEGPVTRYESFADSGNIVSRAFCPKCGSAIHSSNSAMPGMVFVRASSLDNPEAFRPQMIVYSSRAPSWAGLDAALPAFAEMPPGGPPES